MLGKQEMMTIPNPRLMRSKVRSMMYSFTPTYIPGKLHVVPDCFSRRTDSPHPPQPAVPLPTEAPNVGPEYQNTFGPPSWVSQPTAPEAAFLAPLSLTPSAEDTATTEETELFLIGTLMSSLEALDKAPWLEEGLLLEQGLMAPVQLQPMVLSHQRLDAVAAVCPLYTSLRSIILAGAPEDKNMWPDKLLPYYQHRHALVVIGNVVLLHDRPVIPAPLRQEVLEHLHGAHGGVTTMYSRAISCLFWPNLRDDIEKIRAACSSCNLNAPSNPTPPPHPLQHPAYPFSDICADFFEHSSKSYLVVVDRYSNWLSLFQLTRDTSENIIKVLRDYFTTWGVAQSISTDGDKVFTSKEIRTWLKRWDVFQRVSSSYYPRSNKRAEVAVKSGKRMIMDNTGPGGSLQTDKIARALLQHRNCPDPTSNLSPAQVIFGRVLKDHLSIKPGAFPVRPEWRMQADLREKALAQRHILKQEQLVRGTKPLPPLSPADIVMIQDQASPKQPGKWTKTGRVVENQGFDSYLVKVDGSNHVTKRNRRFLRKIVPYINRTDSNQPHPNQTLPPPQPIVPEPIPPQPKPSHTPRASPRSKNPPTERWIVSKSYPSTKPARTLVQSPNHDAPSNPDNNAGPAALPAEATTSTNYSTISPPILLSKMKPQPPGTRHDYVAMSQEADRLRKEAATSRL